MMRMILLLAFVTPLWAQVAHISCGTFACVALKNDGTAEACLYRGRSYTYSGY